MLGEPNGIYLTHFVVEKGTGSNIAQKLYEKTNEISLEKDIFAVGADSTAVNTGSKQGAITLLEEKLKK